MFAQIVGWASSVVLLLTIGQQVWKQWNDRTSKGVSPWLFIGQFAASVGFVVYSLAKKDWVFVITNAVMLVNASIGLFTLVRNRRTE